MTWADDRKEAALLSQELVALCGSVRNAGRTYGFTVFFLTKWTGQAQLKPAAVSQKNLELLREAVKDARNNDRRNKRNRNTLTILTLPRWSDDAE